MVNTAAIRQLLVSAFSPTDLEVFCYDFYQPVVQQFTEGMGQTERIQRLIDYVQRYGMEHQLLAQIKEKNPYQYDRFADVIQDSSIAPIRPETNEEDQILLTLNLAREIVTMLERQKKRFGTGFVPARLLVELEQRRNDVEMLENQLKTWKTTRGRRGTRKGTAIYDILQRIESDDNGGKL